MASCCHSNGKNELPQDQGFSWVICFASFVIILSLGLVMQTLAVLLLELCDEFNTSVTTVSLAVMLFTMSLSVASIFSTYVLVPQFGIRPVVVASGVLLGLSTVANAVVPSIEVFICISGLQGMCTGLIYVPTISIVSFYFVKWQTIATTIANCGISIATIGFPPLLRLILAEFGLRGTYLLVGGLVLHVVIAGMLLRPVDSYSPPRKPDDEEKPPSRLSSHVSSHRSVDNQKDTLKVDNLKLHHFTGADGEATKECDHFEFYALRNHTEDHLLPRSYDSKKDNSELNHSLSSNSADELQRQPSTVPTTPSSPGKVSMLTMEFTARRRVYARQESSWSVTSGVEAVGVSYSMQEQAIGEEDEEEEKDMMNDNPKAKKQPPGCCCRVMKSVFDPHLFKLWGMRLFLLSAILGATNQYILTYIPTISVFQMGIGASRDQGSLLLVITGSVDLVSRFIVGFIADLKLLKPSRLMAIGMFCLGICCHAGVVCKTFDSLVPWAVVMGLFIGIRFSLLPLVLIEIVGIANMAKGFSIVAFLATMSAAIHSPLLSSMFEAYASFDPVLHYLGCALMFTGVMIFFLPNVIAADKRRQGEGKSVVPKV